MKPWVVVLALLAPIAALSGAPASAEGPGAGSAARPSLPGPSLPGQCTLTTIAGVGQRLVDAATGAPIAGSGSSVRFADGLVQTSYEEVPQLGRARAGDSAFVCLMRVPQNCPPGDDRGRVYTTTDLRTMKSWTLPDSEHRCGGA